jgi:hypothetical protein
MRSDIEYSLSKAVSTYLRLQYPKVLFHFDYAGLNLSKAQAGRMKAIQGSRGYPDLFIMAARGKYHGLFIELKPQGTKLLKADGEFATPHLQEQADMIFKLVDEGYAARFGCGIDECIRLIDSYLTL